jgi:hypothetical protein
MCSKRCKSLAFKVAALRRWARGTTSQCSNAHGSKGAKTTTYRAEGGRVVEEEKRVSEEDGS